MKTRGDFHSLSFLHALTKQQLLLPGESFHHSVSVQGHAGLDPTSDRARTQPRRILPLRTPSPVSSASSSSRIFSPNLERKRI